MKKHIPEFAIAIHAIIFIIAGLTIDLYFSVSVTGIMRFLLWAALFVVIDYTFDPDLANAVKFGSLCAAALYVISTALDYFLIYRIEDAVPDAFGYMILGVFNALVFLAYLFIIISINSTPAAHFIRSSLLKLLAVLIVFCLLTLLVCHYFPAPDYSSIFDTTYDESQIQIMRILTILYVDANGIILCLNL